jgi:hypothetical protein
MGGSLPDPAAFAFRAEMGRGPAPELSDAARATLGEVLAARDDITSAWLVREHRTRLLGGSEDDGTTLHLILREPPDADPGQADLHQALLLSVLQVLASSGCDAAVSIPTSRALAAVRSYGACVFQREQE